MLSVASLPLSRTSSMSSVGSDNSVAGSTKFAVDIPIDGAVKRTRKRFTSVQLMILEHLYHKVTHPTREQREQVAKEAEIDIRSVTVWFQNKRQTDRRLHRRLSETVSQSSASSVAPLPPSSPFSDASGNTIHTVRPLTRTLSGTSASSVTSAISGSTSRSRKRDRNKCDGQSALASRHLRLKLSRNLSLDDIAGRTERPALRTQTPPLHAVSSPSPLPRPKMPVVADREEKDAKERALWENMPSSPIAPEPAARVERTLIRYASKRHTLEYVCARKMVGVHVDERSRTQEGRDRNKKRQQRQKERDDTSRQARLVEQMAFGRVLEVRKDEDEDEDLPVADWDIPGDTDTEGFCSETPVTPSSSASFADEKNQVFDDESRPITRRSPSLSVDVQVAKSAPDTEDLIDVAYVLCGLSQRG